MKIVHATDPADPLAVSVHHLDNGLQVWLSVNRDEPRVFASVVVRAGSGEDPRDATGMAHYLEHMLANKGTRRLGTTDYAAEAPHLDRVRALYDQLHDTDDSATRAEIYRAIDAEGLAAAAFGVPNELKQAYSAMGGRGFNATTSKERTNYFVDLPSNMLPRWAVLEADRFTSAVFRAFQTEVETVYEEKNRALDNAGRRSSAALDRLLWGEHPYGTEILGEGVHLKNPRVSRMERFFADWYTPDNMAIVVAGDVDPAEALPLLQARFGHLRPGSGPERASPSTLPTLRGETVEELVHHGQPAVHLAWRTVGWDHPDRPALRMVDLLLDNGKTGLFDTALNAPGVVRKAGAYPRRYRDGGAQIVWARPRDEQTCDEAAELLLQQVERIRSGDFDSGLLDAVFVNWKLGELAARESNSSRAQWMTSAFVHRWSWSAQQGELERHRAVSKDDIVRVARTWLGGDRVRVIRRTGAPLLERISAPPLTPRPIPTAQHSSLFREVQAMPVRPLPSQTLQAGIDWQERSLSSEWGGRGWFAANPHSDLAQLVLTWDVGFETDRRMRHALALLTLAGVGTLDRLSFDAALYARGLSQGTRCGRHHTQLVLAGPGEVVEELLPLVLSRMESGRVDPDTGRAWIQDAIARRQADKSTRATLANAARGLALYGGDSTALAYTPSDAELIGLFEESDGAQAWRSLLPALLQTRFDLTYVGNSDPDRIVGRVDACFGERAPADVRPPIEKARGETAQVIFVHHESVQAGVTLYRNAGPSSVDRMAGARLLREYLGGSSGVFFQEVREARAMAYSTSGGMSTGWREGDDDLLWAQAVTQADKAVDATELMARLLVAPIDDPGRFERVRAAVVKKLEQDRIGFRDVPAVARHWHQRGLPGDPRPLLRSTVRGMQLSDLDHFARTAARGPITAVVVGDRGRIDLAALSRVGPVVELGADALLSY